MNDINLIIFGESCVDGMAGAIRLRNIVELISLENVSVTNIYFLKVNQSERVINGIKQININYSIKGLINAIKYLNIKGKKNILYHYDQPDFLTIFIIFYSRLINYKIIVDIVEDYSVIELDGLKLKNKIKILSKNLFVKFLNYYADTVVVISKNLYNKVIKYNVLESKIVHIPISINIKEYVKKKEEGKKNPVKLFYGGSFGDKDGINFLLEAFNEISIDFPNIILNLSGSPALSYKEKFFLQLQKYNNLNISYLGFLPREEYLELLLTSDILFMLRVNSEYAKMGFPFKLGEMLATGNPVITTKIEGIKDFLEDMENALLVESNSSKDIVRAIKYIIENPEKSAKIGANARRIAKRYFDRELFRDKIYNLLEYL